jgi:hypothetical protein
LVATFIDQLKARCAVKTADEKQALVLGLMAEDAKAGLDGAAVARRQELVQFLEDLWNKYRVTLDELRGARAGVETRFEEYLGKLGYE